MGRIFIILSMAVCARIVIRIFHYSWRNTAGLLIIELVYPDRQSAQNGVWLP